MMRYYWTERRSEFNPLLHGVFPLFSTIALIYVGYKSIVPLPSMPVGAAPYLVGVWLVAGAVLVGVMSRTGKEEWLVKAGEAAHEVPAASETQPTPAG